LGGQGNIILTDAGCHILSVLRVVQPNEDTRIAAHEQYDTSQAQAQRTVTEAELRAALEAAPDEPVKKTLGKLGPCVVVITYSHVDPPADAVTEALPSCLPARTTLTVVVVALGEPDYTPALCEHLVARAGLRPATPGSVALASMPALAAAVADLDAFVAAAADVPSPGYIFLLPTPAPATGGKGKLAEAAAAATAAAGPLYVTASSGGWRGERGRELIRGEALAAAQL
jgi:hypothetical protein